MDWAYKIADELSKEYHFIPVDKVAQVLRDERERCAIIAEDFDIMGNSPYAAADMIAKAIRTSVLEESKNDG